MPFVTVTMNNDIWEMLGIEATDQKQAVEELILGYIEMGLHHDKLVRLKKTDIKWSPTNGQDNL